MDRAHPKTSKEVIPLRGNASQGGTSFGMGLARGAFTCHPYYPLLAILPGGDLI